MPGKYPDKWPGRYPSSLDNSVAFKLFNIPTEQLKPILLKCKQYKVTFTAYLVLCQAIALLPIYGNKHHTLCLVAVTLRRFFNAEKAGAAYAPLFENNYRLLGNYAHMGLPELLPPTTDFSWEKVQAINDHLLQTVTNDKLLNTSKAFTSTALMLESNRDKLMAGIGQNKADAIKISNLGAVRFPVYEDTQGEPWTIEDIVFAQDMAPGAAEFVLNVVSSQRGGLNIVMSYFDHHFEAGYTNFDEFPERLRRELLAHA